MRLILPWPAGGALLSLWAAGDTGDDVGAATTSSADHQAALQSAADESGVFLAWAEASNIGDLTVEQMHSDLRRTAHDYLRVPTLPLFARTRAIRDHAFALLKGRQRPGQTRDLYAAAGWALTLLAWMSTDLGRPDAADKHARVAWLCADNADSNGLRSWVRATQHTTAFWEGRFLDGARFAGDGLRFATAGSAGMFLASAYANGSAVAASPVAASLPSMRVPAANLQPGDRASDGSAIVP